MARQFYAERISLIVLFKISGPKTLVNSKEESVDLSTGWTYPTAGSKINPKAFHK
jgi:hypothetical protein